MTTNSWITAAGALVLAGAFGCAAQTSLPLERARLAYEDASSDPAVAQAAPVELHEAGTTLARAEEEWDDGDDKDANTLAYVSERNSQIARTKASTAVKPVETQVVEIFKQTDRGLVLTLEDVLFETGRADLKPGAANRLDEVVAYLAEHPDKHVMVEGHTDSVGTPSFNQQLSEARAVSVKSFLARRGVSPFQIHTRGYGESFPVASNANDGGRQQNRRVELVITDADRVVWLH
jgi:outer membrane protein OmpA-like peptidoglycan-associated protein